MSFQLFVMLRNKAHDFGGEFAPLRVLAWQFYWEFDSLDDVARDAQDVSSQQLGFYRYLKAPKEVSFCSGVDMTAVIRHTRHNGLSVIHTPVVS